jgi:23S rRNA (pseudouridine1915-N3)-methyltransferase
MRLLVCAVGRLKAGPERELVERYQSRLTAMGRALGLGPLATVELEESRARRAGERRADEAARLLAAATAANAVPVALDEGGRSLASEAFAARVGAWRDGGAGTLAFLIGGPDGHGPEIPARAALVLSLGAMTWPHQIVRCLLVEQLYRAATILAGHPYHRG